jgi:hypothetical protein
MTEKVEGASAGGRPKLYTTEQVWNVVDQMIKSGRSVEEINARSVKPLLCDLHGVSPGIREESLATVVDHVLGERAKGEREALLKALPGPVTDAVDQALATLKQELLILVGRQNATCLATANEECEVLRADKRNAQFRIAELEASIQDQAAVMQRLEEERDTATAELDEAREELQAALSKLEIQSREAATVERLLTELRDPAIRNDIRTVLVEIVKEPAP